METVTPDSETGEETRTVITNHRFLYRGYLQIAALDLTRSALNDLWLITWDPTQTIATRPLAIQKDGTWYTYGLDLPKNITEVYGFDGYIKTTYTYRPYGNVTSTGNITQPLQWSSEFTDTDLGLVYYNYRHYNPLDGRWTGRDIKKEYKEANLYKYAKNSNNYYDYLGMVWVWYPAQISEVSVTFDESMRKRNYGKPNVKVTGIDASIAETIAKVLGTFNDKLNRDLFNHYLNGNGADFDVTGNATIKNEVLDAFSGKMNEEHDKMLSTVERMKCPNNYNGVITSGDENFVVVSPREHYVSKVMVVGHAFLKLEKKTTVHLTCCQGKATNARIISEFRMFFYDQFADAADWDHTIEGAQEYKGGIQFDEIGAWGRNIEQRGVNKEP